MTQALIIAASCIEEYASPLLPTMVLVVVLILANATVAAPENAKSVKHEISQTPAVKLILVKVVGVLFEGVPPDK